MYESGFLIDRNAILQDEYGYYSIIAILAIVIDDDSQYYFTANIERIIVEKAKLGLVEHKEHLFKHL